MGVVILKRAEKRRLDGFVNDDGDSRQPCSQ